jgi:hypothetical protein
MPSTYTTNGGIELPANGEQSGTWGETVNDNMAIIDRLTNGVGAISLSGTTHTLTTADGTLSDGQYNVLVLGGSPSGTNTITISPNDGEHVYIVKNASGQTATFTQGSGANVSVLNNTTKIIYADGAGAGAAVVDITGALDLGSLIIAGTTTITAVLDEDNMASDSATALATQQSIKAYVDAQVDTVDTLAEILAIGNTTGATDIAVDSAQKVQFRDAAIYINSSVDGQLDIVADTEIQIAATTVDLNGNLDVSGTLGVTGVLTATSLDISGDIDVDGTTNLDVVDIDGAVDMASTLLVTGVLTTTAATVSNGGGQFNGAINVGVDDTGYDVKFFGATTGKSLLWDESADSLTVAGNLSVDGGTIKLDGNYPVGTANVALGDTALDSNVSGASNVAIGADALTANTASNNTAVGYQSGYSNTTGHSNTSVGKGAFYTNTTGVENNAFGFQALYSNTTGSTNTALGRNTLYTNTTGQENVAVGGNSLYYNTTGAYNTAVGYTALGSNTTASDNTAVGYQAGYSNTTGTPNTYVGYQAGYYSITGTNNTALGYGALLTNTVGSNTAVGWNVLRASTTGTGNTAMGADAPGLVGNPALRSNTTGTRNSAFGSGSLGLNTTGSYNTALGTATLYSNTTASNNTAVGTQAGYSTTTGSGYNTFIGQTAGVNLTTGSNNVLVGTYAGGAMTTGTLNTFIGSAAGGYGSGYSVTTGSKNTIVGAYNGNSGGLDIRTSDNNIVLSDGDGNPRLIGNSAGAFFIQRTSTYAYANGSLCVEGTSGNPCLVVGTSGTSSYNNVVIGNGNGGVGAITTSGSSTAYNTSSDYRLKENVVYDWDATTRFKQLKPARFNFIADADTTVDGFLAHEAQAVVPECVTGTKDAVDADGVAVMQGIDQSKLVPLLVKTIQELEARITALENL